MPSIDNILAQGLQPTTPWKSPVAMEQEQQALVNSKVINQANQLKIQQEQDAIKRQQQSQQAWARAAQEAGPDPDKFLALGVQYGGTPEEQMKFRAGFDTSAKAHSELDKEKQALSEAHNKRIIGGLESIPLAGNDPIAQAYQYKVVLNQLKKEGIDTSHLPESHPGMPMLTGILNAHGMAGSAIERAKAQQALDIARLTEERAQADQAIQEAQAKVDAQKAPLEVEKLQNEVLAGKIDPETGLTRAQRYEKDQAMLTPDWKNYLLTIPQGEKPSAAGYDAFLDKEANRHKPVTSVTVNNNPDTYLTPTEAQTLGVPYGSKRIDAFGVTPTTEGERIAATYAQRLDESNDIINAVTPKIAGKGLIGAAEQALSGAAPNVLKPDEMQQFEQARRNFINAVLRKESGAVISDNEFKNAEQQYFPVPGDSETTLKQKEANRKAALDGMVRSAGGAYKPKQSSPKIRITVGGKTYDYKGSGATDDLANYKEVKP